MHRIGGVIFGSGVWSVLNWRVGGDGIQKKCGAIISFAEYYDEVTSDDGNRESTYRCCGCGIHWRYQHPFLYSFV
jgi:hypothetical protein